MRAHTTFKATLGRVLADLGLALPEKAVIEPPKDPTFGDLATNAALLLAGAAKSNPRALAADVAARLTAADSRLAKAEVAGPGFINVTFTPAFWQETVCEVLAAGERYGASSLGAGQKVQVEYVSANPTGPLHIGHGRGAAIGDSLTRILRFAGYTVETEYYINDAGRQMRMLGTSIHARYRELLGAPAIFPEDGYKGEYIKDLAQEIIDARGRALLDLPEAEAVDACYDYGMNKILDGIKEDLVNFRVEHQVWFSEKSLVASGAVQRSFDNLKARGLAFEQDGALWFRTTDFGDDKDRVLRKSSGELTYFASDIAYHDDKYRRGFDLVIDIWGADHHGYIPRMRAGIAALGKAPEQFDVILVQLVNLLRGGAPVAMSTRAGEFETLHDVISEVGTDSARFMFLSRKSDSKLDFDLELVKQKSMDNPVYYVQYAYARISSVFAKAQEAGLACPTEAAPALLSQLDTPADIDLLRALERFPDAVEAAARTHSPHHVSYYLRELAGLLHRYYTLNPVLAAPNAELTSARLLLLSGVATTLANGLALLGVSAPRRM